MKIRIMHDSMYPGLALLNFPIEVEATMRGDCFMVAEVELKRIGGIMEYFSDEEDPFWPFLKSEVEVVE